MTEDHPLQYLDFAGEIPRGEYGAGTMTVWDTGTYELEKWRDDEVIATLDGRADGPLGRVRLALIRTEGRGEKSQWLLHRMKTDADGRPQADGDPVVARDHADAPTSAPPPEPTLAELRPMLATSATPGIARAAAERWGSPWVEMKWDGIRGLGVWDGRRLRLRSRNGNDLTSTYPDLTGVDLGLGDLPAVLDGEIVALDEQGRPSFPLLQRRMNLAQPERSSARPPGRRYSCTCSTYCPRAGGTWHPFPSATGGVCSSSWPVARGSRWSCLRSSTTWMPPSRRARDSASRGSW